MLPCPPTATLRDGVVGGVEDQGMQALERRPVTVAMDEIRQ